MHMQTHTYVYLCECVYTREIRVEVKYTRTLLIVDGLILSLWMMKMIELLLLLIGFRHLCFFV